MKKILTTLKIFILTIILYPFPICTWSHTGKACFPLPPGINFISVWLSKLLWVHLLIALLISIATQFTMLQLDKKKLWLNIFKNKRYNSYATFILVWIICATILSIPLIFYGLYITPTGGIE